MNVIINPKRPKSKKRKLFFKLLVVLSIFVIIAVAVDARIRPLIKTVAASNATYIATRAIYDSVNEELLKENVSYNDLVVLEKDNENRVTALRTDITRVNQLKARLSVAIYSKLESIDTLDVAIPLGNFFGADILSGRGPKIKFKTIPNGNFTADIKNVFSSAGINQVHHQIYIEVNAQMYSMLPGYTTPAQVTTTVLVAESVIVGVVPNNFTTIDLNKQ